MSISSQREVLAGFKKEIYQNVSLLSVIYPPECDISKLVFKEESYEKPTQQIFMHLSYYLAVIIDQEKAKTFSWPLYDSQKEKQYRTDISSFIASYASKGVISPVISSFLVNPGCYKVVKLMFQLSQLAVQKTLLCQLKTDAQKSTFHNITQKFKTENVHDFVEDVEKETIVMSSKLVHYQQKRKVMEAIAIKLQKGIVANEAKLEEIKYKIKLNTWIDEFLNKSTLSEESKSEMALLKDVNKHNPIYDKWLQYIDKNIDNLESEWNRKVTPSLDSAKLLQNYSDTLISRHTGDCDKKSYILEYDPTTNPITTSNLEQEANSQQKYVLKNIIMDGTVQFPFLIQGFVVSIGYILRGHRVENIDSFNECLDVMLQQYNEVKTGLRDVLDRVIAAEKRLQVPALCIRVEIQNTNLLLNIPTLPDLSDLRANTGAILNTTNTFTPLNMSKHKFNLRKRTGQISHNKPFTKNLNLVTPFQPRTKDNFPRNVVSCQLNYTQQTDFSQNISIISHGSNPTNETIAEFSSGFSKHQVLRLLSTQKSSVKKKKFTPKPGKGMQIRGLFDESQDLFRSHSSPNLMEGLDRKISRRRRLPALRDASLLEVSGIDVLSADSREDTLRGEYTRKSLNKSLPKIFISPSSEMNSKLLEKLNDFDTPSPIDKIEPQTAYQHLEKLTQSANKKLNDFIKRTEDIRNSTTINSATSACYDYIFEISDVTVEKSGIDTVISDVKEQPKHKPVASKIPIPETKTPTTKPRNCKQQSSLEKIINRYKKLRPLAVTDQSIEAESTEPLFNDKENINIKNGDNFAVPSSLPDLVSPSCNMLESNYARILDEFKGVGRQSLGTILGVDESVLDGIID